MSKIKNDGLVMMLPTARAVEEALNRDSEDDWTYLVERIGTDRAKVAVYDEDGDFLGYL